MTDDAGDRAGAETPVPWYEESWAIVSAGVAGVLAIGVLIYAVLNTAESSVDPTGGPQVYPDTSTSRTTSPTTSSPTTSRTTTSRTTTSTITTTTSTTDETTSTTTTETTSEENPFFVDPFQTSTVTSTATAGEG
ncbi:MULTISPECIES: hypothetical protein [Mycobacteriaceae]|uniref:Uncharacterized protein n=1 Tax=Mycolicibacterium neoaurum VKM Ac-1815D TaxID=700508 RepID=V5X5Z2_MYCNE|nr:MULTISPECIES: hypothetical protein [Mycobacteriaceae]AXK77756.1 hypothetical protein DXK33_24300 [Mycolicibacterium neoaurum]KUM06110.1 hypothetical protein AVZ31_23460 [Mycolicibacterium neoaurum]